MLLYSLGVFDMRFYIRLIVALSLMGWGQFVFAVDYSWTFSSNGDYQGSDITGFSSGSDACLAGVPLANIQFPTDPTASYSNYVIRSDSRFDCKILYTYSGGSTFINNYGVAVRSGDSCSPDTTHNPATGGCEAPPPPPPECKVGDLFPSKGSVGPVITSDNGSKHVSSNPQTMCQNQCEYADPTARPSGCYALPGDQGYCNFIIKGTGNNCSADNYEVAVSGDRLNPPDTPNVPDSSPDPICPPGWSSSGGTCFKNPPKFCDPSTGEICAPGTTDPDKPAPDAGTGGTEGTPREGDGGRPDSSSGADKDLQDLQDSKPDAEACKPAADGSGCSGSTVKGEQCDKVVECTGDAVQCSILRQQKKMACAYEYEEARPFIEQQIAKEPYQVKSESVSGSELFTAGLNAPRWMPQGCPAPKSISIKGVSTSLSFEPACDFARGLGPLFVALASIFFAVYVGRAFGGN